MSTCLPVCPAPKTGPVPGTHSHPHLMNVGSSDSWGARVAQSVKCLTLDLGSGHDLMVCQFEPVLGSLLSAWSLLQILSLPLSLSLSYLYSLKNKY